MTFNTIKTCKSDPHHLQASSLSLLTTRISMFQLLLLLLVLSVPIVNATSVLAIENRHVLVLHSYHHGLKWTDSEEQGINSVFKQHYMNLELHTEYLDSKTIVGKDYFDLFAQMIKKKYAKTPISVVIATDDDAFNFYLAYQKDLFPTTPVVFCGVNYFKDEQREGRENLITGVVESFDIPETLNVALKLRPAASRVVVINDRTTTGIANRSIMDDVIPRFSKRVRFEFYDDLSMDELLVKVQALTPSDIILLLTFNRDRLGNVFNYDQSIGLIAEKASVPIFGVWDFYLGSGIAGGMLNSGYDQGRMAGEMALRVVNGEKVAAMPVVRISPNHFMFDYKYLERYGMPVANLPMGSRVINKPPTFYELNKNLVWGMLSGIVMLSLIVVLLLLNIRITRRGAEALQVSEERFRSLLDNLNVGIYRCTAGPPGRFIQANPAMLKVFGFESFEELSAVTIDSLYQFVGDRYNFLEELANCKSVHDKEVAMRRKDGKHIWASISATAQYDGDGNIKWIDSMLEDVTKRKLLEVQLRQSQKMEAIGTLAGGIAHDFNNILTAVVGYGEMLRARLEGDGKLRNYASEILTAADRAANLTKGLLAFSRKQVIAPKAVDLNEVVNEIEKLLKRVIGEEIELNISLSATPLIVLADSGQIEQVIVNLVTNARDALSGEGVIKIRTDRITLQGNMSLPSLKPGDYAIMTVSDSGCGMDEEMLQRIFEPFFTTKSTGKGTGLGLSIVYGIIQQHNGEIVVYSEPGMGTTFKIYLNLINSVVENKEKSVVMTPVGGSEVILVAEDDPVVRHFVKSILEQYGYTVFEAVDGFEAVEIFKRERDSITMLILDVVMPRMNGKDAYDAISELRPGIPALFCSGYTDDIISSKGVIDEDINFISKPFSSHLLLSKIREILAETQAK